MAYLDRFERDTWVIDDGEVAITFLGHGTLMLTCAGKAVHLDPYGEVADYSALPSADVILVTHEHGDHLDEQALSQIRREDTAVVLTDRASRRVSGGMVMQNGDTRTLKGLRIEAVPAYNIRHTRPSGEPFHPEGEGNGYVVTCGDLRIYFAGDTEDIPEMADLRDIDVAFLPMNLPYTMSPEMAAHAARMVQPAIVYPYHYGGTDPHRLVDLLESESDIEVRIRRLA